MSDLYFKLMSAFGCEHGGIARRSSCRYNCCDSENCVTWLEKQFAKLNEYEEAKADGRLVVLPETGIGDLSDGYHTFNELYHHRAILFSVICNEHPDISWKSKLHHDGTMFDGMFIVGINTPEGQATYHYDINPYWDMFRVRELEKAPEWDGHTSEQAIERIASLTREKAEKALRAEDVIEPKEPCDFCKYIYTIEATSYTYTEPIASLSGLSEINYCPKCGRSLS